MVFLRQIGGPDVFFVDADIVDAPTTGIYRIREPEIGYVDVLPLRVYFNRSQLERIKWVKSQRVRGDADGRQPCRFRGVEAVLGAERVMIGLPHREGIFPRETQRIGETQSEFGCGDGPGDDHDEQAQKGHGDRIAAT